ncbi:heavy-metal-associated domain-containing protein [Devosia sp. UYZn731]|uniref:heavy-metal-associated domain-containing protein n=1 Tax=Devosia sp. UYZn731 TaxID=3156345 RepID=UPI003393ED5F
MTHPVDDTNGELQMLNFQVNDMTCSHCVGTVEKAVQSADPAAKVLIDLATKVVRIDSTQPAASFAQAIEDAGYTGNLKS